MGTLQEESRPGIIYLNHNVTRDFNNILASAANPSADAFIEHLFDLHTKQDEQNEMLKIRPDLAQQFAALQSITQFETSNGLMKHLLALHLQHVKTSVVETPKQTLGKTATRKSRKSLPKRSLKHTVWIDSQTETGDVSTEGDVSQNSWREKSVSSGEDTEVTTDINENNKAFNLSVVKQEVMDEGEEVVRSGRDAGLETGPLCLTLHKPTSAREAAQGQQLLPQGPIKSKKIDIPKLIKYSNANQASIEASVKNSRQFTQSNWRSSSEPARKFADHVSPQQAALSLQVSPQGHLPVHYTQMDTGNGIAMGQAYPILGHILDKRRSENLPNDNTDRQGNYNYVLNSLASDTQDSSLSSSLPASPMHVPVKYPKSIQYTASSDENEDEPEDLSLNSTLNDEQPQNLILSTNKPSVELGKKSENLVKYDRNANAVTMIPIAQLQNGQFIAQNRFPAPQNLIFHDARGVANGLIGQPQILSLPQNNSSVAQEGESVVSQPMPVNQSGVFVSAPGAPPPHLQLVAVRRPPPLMSPVFIQKGLVSPNTGNTKFVNSTQHILVPVSPADVNMMLSPSNNSGPNGDVSLDDKSDDAAQQRKKRKKMEDTTSFRDPPEQSLPFNGPNKYRFYCDVCDTGFTRRYTFNRHKCKGRVEKHYCQLCDKAYLSKYKLKDHILVKHEGQTVNCPDCGKRFSSRSSMEMHKKQQHEGLFTIWCKVCGKGFNHTGHYYGHMNKHTNTKPFWCQQCGKRFYGSSYLHNHKQVCRGNSDLNYACTLCDRKFKCELYLKKHMKVHDNTAVISDPTVTDISGQDLSNDSVGMADQDSCLESAASVNGDIYGGPVFPNGPEDSNSNSGMLVIDETLVADDKGSADVVKMKSVTDAKTAGNDGPIVDKLHQQAMTA